MNRGAATVALLWALGLAAVGCELEPSAPASPTWANDVYPIVRARCIRCHNAQLTGDPAIGKTAMGGDRRPSSNFDYPTWDAIKLAVFAPLAPMYITQMDPKMRMPPPPYAELEGWQVDTITAFSKSPK